MKIQSLKETKMPRPIGKTGGRPGGSAPRPKISFVVPVYNAEAHLERCLASLRRQTLSDFEVVMIDDGSTDGSAAICREFARGDVRFRYKRQKNAWLSAARNAGLRLAGGEYVAFVDADDYIDEQYCEALSAAQGYGTADLLVFGYRMNHEGGGESPGYLPEGRRIRLSGDTLLSHFCVDWLRPRRVSYAWNKLYRRAFVERCGASFPENVRFCEDRSFNYTLLPSVGEIEYLPLAPYHYYQHAASACRTSARSVNIIRYYLQVYLDVTSRWRAGRMRRLDAVKPVMLMRMLQAAFYCTAQAGNSVADVALRAEEALAPFPLEEELEPGKVRTAIRVLADACGLDWPEQTKLWLFAISVLDGREAICAWQELYPAYSALLAEGG